MTEQKTYSMRMAKADKDDLEAAYQVMNLLDSHQSQAFIASPPQPRSTSPATPRQSPSSPRIAPQGIRMTPP